MESGKYIFIVQVTRQLTIDIINHFSEKGKKVILLTGIVESNYSELNPNVQVKYLNKHTAVSTARRLLSWFIFTGLSFFYVLFKSRKYHLILITTPPFIVFLGSFFNRIRKQQFHLVIWDLYPDVLVKMKILKERSFPIKCWAKANIDCFKRAGNLFTLGEHLSAAISQYTEKKPIIIPNWSNTDFIKPIPKNENLFLHKYNLEDKFIVMYSGNLGLTHNIEAIIETAEKMTGNTMIQFIIIGDGAKKDKIIKWAKDKNLLNIMFLPYQDKQMLPFSLSSADIGIVTLDEGAENVSVPSKTYYLLAAGVSMLAFASKNSELGNLVKKHHCGAIFENPDAEEVARYIRELAFDKNKLDSYKENSREASFCYTPKNAELYYDFICLKHLQS